MQPLRSFCNAPWFKLSVPPVSGFLGLLVSGFLGFLVSWFLGFLVSGFLAFFAFGVSCLGFKCDPVGFRTVCVASFPEVLGWGC